MRSACTTAVNVIPEGRIPKTDPVSQRDPWDQTRAGDQIRLIEHRRQRGRRVAQLHLGDALLDRSCGDVAIPILPTSRALPLSRPDQVTRHPG